LFPFKKSVFFWGVIIVSILELGALEFYVCMFFFLFIVATCNLQAVSFLRGFVMEIYTPD